MKELLIKVCGLKYPRNVDEVAELQPDYMGFILYKGSQRYVDLQTTEKLVKNIPRSINRVGVLVNEPIETALNIAKSGIFDILQLHGNESTDYCRKLSKHIRIIKAFSVKNNLPNDLSDYQPFCEQFLFDTAGEKQGGNGRSFDHNILKQYSVEKKYILSGGISPNDTDYLKSINTGSLAGVDLNSRFEVKPGIKDIILLKTFIGKLRGNDSKY
jgi:phosphoribosylanthranilate isomerase